MDTVVNSIVSFFSILTDKSVFGMPLIVWFLIPLILGLVVNFLKGKKD